MKLDLAACKTGQLGSNDRGLEENESEPPAKFGFSSGIYSRIFEVENSIESGFSGRTSKIKQIDS